MPRLTLEPFVVTPRALHETIILPQFGDFIDADPLNPSPEDGDWMIMDDVVYQRPIVNLIGQSNILKRRDATCKLIYSPVGRLSARYIRTEALYGATEDCQEEFYQGCFIDYSQANFDVFGEKVMTLMEKGIATDLYSNKWFGDVTRPSDVTGQWSWNKFDGIFTHYAKYIADGVIPSSQTFILPDGALTPQNAKDALDTAFSKQDGLLKLMAKADKVFYVSSDLADAYEQWLVLAGQATIQDRMNGVSKLYYKKIEVKVKDWDGVLMALNGGVAAHAIILTVKGNFLFATDKKYGGGPRRNEAVRVWWSDDDNVWRRQMHMKAGTELIAPQHSVIGLTSI